MLGYRTLGYEQAVWQADGMPSDVGMTKRGFGREVWMQAEKPAGGRWWLKGGASGVVGTN